ncbi:MAG TPA: hypothetical protein VMV18_03775 [bacterium]|nr:hypothetical protein [bacterium]
MSGARLARLFALAAVAASLAACGFRNVERVPPQEADTLKPESSITNAQLRDRMRIMAAHASRLEKILRQPTVSAADRKEVIVEIGAIDEIARGLSQEDARTVHPVLWKNIDRFREDVANAKLDAEKDPPNFFLAGTIAGSCSYCHGPDFGKVH